MEWKVDESGVDAPVEPVLSTLARNAPAPGFGVHRPGARRLVAQGRSKMTPG